MLFCDEKIHEIARLDHSFERGLSTVTAEYTLRSDGGIDVLNRGYDRGGGAWKEAEGKAYFPGGKNEGRLKVINSLKRRRYPREEEEKMKPLAAVFFRIDRELPLIGAGDE